MIKQNQAQPSETEAAMGEGKREGKLSGIREEGAGGEVMNGRL